MLGNLCIIIGYDEVQKEKKNTFLISRKQNLTSPSLLYFLSFIFFFFRFSRIHDPKSKHSLNLLLSNSCLSSNHIYSEMTHECLKSLTSKSPQEIWAKPKASPYGCSKLWWPWVSLSSSYGYFYTPNNPHTQLSSFLSQPLTTETQLVPWIHMEARMEPSHLDFKFKTQFHAPLSTMATHCWNSTLRKTLLPRKRYLLSTKEVKGQVKYSTMWMPKHMWKKLVSAISNARAELIPVRTDGKISGKKKKIRLHQTLKKWRVR